MTRDSDPRRQAFRLVYVVLVVALALVGNLSSLAAPPPDDAPVFETISLPPDALSVSADLFVRGARVQKLDSAMARLAAADDVSLAEAQHVARLQSLRLSDSRVQVQIVTHPAGLENAMRAVAGAGGEVTDIGNDRTLIQGWLPIRSLRAVADEDDVYLIRRPDELVTLEVALAGRQTTEGLAAINGPAWHAAGYTGTGVRIGIIDGGFEGYTALLGTDLPPSVTVKNFVDGESDAQVDGDGSHGTACAEIVHDIAPDASLYLAKIGTNLDLQQAVAWLKDTHHVDIISTSFGFYNVTPGDGTGQFADLAQSARDAGILWVTAAGNDRQAHWGGPYYDPGNTGIHHYDDIQNVNHFGPGDGSAYLIPAGYRIQVFLRWDDWTYVDQDYDLFLLRSNGTDWDTAALSWNEQSGRPGQRPVEAAYAVTSGPATVYGFAIRRYSSDRTVAFEVFAPQFLRPDKILPARSLVNLADAPALMTVAALDATSPYPQEYYSSEGPTNGPGGAAAGGFTKPDIAGFANVSTASYGSAYKFNGTSAATPHVAGAAALVLSAYPSYTPDQVRSFLQERAIDMGPAGMDTQFGQGRLHLGFPPFETAFSIYLPLVIRN